MEKLSLEQYQNQFRDSKREKALERAWKNRDFEIELYWKRATYFWAFTAATFTAYFVVLSKEGGKSSFAQYEYIELVVAIMGLIFAIAWVQVNRGSKKWQENWEKHIDLLEDEITGPIYKTVLKRERPSVSGTNQVISYFVTFVWVVLILGSFEETIVNKIGEGYLKRFSVIVLIIFILELLRIRKSLIRSKYISKWLDRIYDKNHKSSKRIDQLKIWLYRLLKPSGEFEFELRPITYKQSKKKDQTDKTISKT